MTFEEWIQTESGKGCATMPVTDQKYLQNRLWWAFEAGRHAERGDLRPTGQHPNTEANGK